MLNRLAGSPFFQMGYRPFFFLGSLYAIVSVLLWALWYGYRPPPFHFFNALAWHAHEMIFGFALAIIVGFLLTASATWTKTRGLFGKPLLLLVVLWGAARVLMIVSQYISSQALFVTTSIVDLSLTVLSLIFLSPPILHARVWRNINILFLLTVFGLGNLLFHLQAHEIFIFDVSAATKIGVHAIALLLTIIGGRVIPFFTQNANPDQSIKKFKLLEWLVMGGVIAAGLSDLLSLNRFFEFSTFIFLIVGSLHIVRLWFWRSHCCADSPLLWILHVGYFWIGLFYFFLYLSEAYGFPARAISYHALTIGAMGVLIIGMMSRVSLGHSGRPLILPKGMLISYFSILLAGALRITIALVPELYILGIRVVAALWILSFLVFLIYYSPIFFKVRPDGRPG